MPTESVVKESLDWVAAVAVAVVAAVVVGIVATVVIAVIAVITVIVVAAIPVIAIINIATVSVSAALHVAIVVVAGAAMSAALHVAIVVTPVRLRVCYSTRAEHQEHSQAQGHHASFENLVYEFHDSTPFAHSNFNNENIALQ